MNTKVVQVINQTSTLKLIAANGEFVSIQKIRLKLKYTPTAVFLYDDFERGQAPLQVEDDCYILSYESVTEPAEANNEDLATVINTYIQISTGGGGGGDAWKLAGNTDGLQKLGTLDNFNLPFYTNNTQKAVLTKEGRFGLNVAVPTAAFEIKSITTSDYKVVGIDATTLTAAAGVGIGIEMFAEVPVDKQCYGLRVYSKAPYVGNGNTEAVSFLGISQEAGYFNAGLRGEAKEGTGSSYGIYGKILSGSAVAGVYGTAAVFGINQSSTGPESYGGQFTNLASHSAGKAIAVKGETIVNGPAEAVGGQFSASGGSSYNHAIVCPASGGNNIFGANLAFARVHILGSDASSANYALKVDNVSYGKIAWFRNDGQIEFGSVQTGNAGLSAGSMYKDTAANVLTNGDYVLALKA